MSIATLDQIDWAAREREFGETLCRSNYCNDELGKLPHPAQWWAVAQCRDVLPICESRRQLCRSVGGWFCEPDGCGRYHTYDRIRFYPLRPHG